MKSPKIFFLLLLCSCKWKDFSFLKAPTPHNNQPAEYQELQLPFTSKEEIPPLLENWIDYLREPRLAFWPGLKLACNESPTSLLLKFSFEATPLFACEDIIHTNPLESSWKCLNPTTLQYTLDASRSNAHCENQIQFYSLLRDLRMPAKASPLYKEKTPGFLESKFQPLPQDIPLPNLRLWEDKNNQENALKMEIPDFEDWFDEAFESGAVALVLEVPTSKVTDPSIEQVFSSLVRFIAQQKEPTKLRFFLNPSSVATAKKKSKTNPPFFIVSKNESADPLFQEACNYIGSWLKAEQILSGLDPKESSLFPLDCRFSWGEKPLFSKYAMTISKFPLPLGYSSPNGNFIFPFRNLQDCLSPNVFRSLKKP